MLEAIDQNAEPEDQDGIRRLRVVYGKRSILGRRTASYPSMQACPSSLRPLLLKLYYHDIDIVNCHPTLMIQVCEKMGKLHAIPNVGGVRGEQGRHAPAHRRSLWSREGELQVRSSCVCSMAALSRSG